jgi:hypothetical protein
MTPECYSLKHSPVVVHELYLTHPYARPKAIVHVKVSQPFQIRQPDQPSLGQA